MRKTRQEARHYWMPLSALVLLFAMVLVVAGVIQYPRQPAHAASADWPTFLGSNARTGFNGQETTINAQTAPNLKLLWTDQTKGHVSSEPLMVNGVLYWGSWDGLFHVTNPTTGKDSWAKNLGQKAGTCSAGSYDGTSLYQAGGITTINGQKCAGSVRAMDPNTGNFIWQVCLGNTVLGGVVSVAGLVVVGCANTMYVLDSAIGNTLYSYVDTTSNAKFWGAATFSNGVLYDGSRSGKLFAFGL